MLKQKHRLRRTKDIKQASAKGRSFFNPLFTLKYLRKPQEQARFTVVVSTKVAAKAVKRNRIKRVIRETIRAHLSDFTGGDYVLYTKPKVAALNPTQLRLEFISFIKKYNLA